MQLRNTSDRYGAMSVMMHWLMVGLIVIMYASINIRELVEDTPWDYRLLVWHKSVGMLILFLVALRLLWRFAGKTPAIAPQPPEWQERASKWVHMGLYAFLIILPITGYLLTVAGNHPVEFFGTSLPQLIGPNKSLSHFMRNIHELVANAGYALVGLHAVAALWHHYMLRDNTLVRMLPVLKDPSR